MKVYGSSGETAAARSATSAASRPRPRARRSSSGIASPTSPLASITTTASSCGSRSRTAAILATWLASSQMTNFDSELPATHSHSSGEFVG